MNLKALARLGAEVRVREIQAELAAIRRAFPAVKTSSGSEVGNSRRAADGGQKRRRRRWKMSAAQKKAVGIRMKKYWAARRKARG
jgi:hypothetical protein